MSVSPGGVRSDRSWSLEITITLDYTVYNNSVVTMATFQCHSINVRYIYLLQVNL